MANAQRGEVTFPALGRDWTIKLGTNALCEIEADLGKTIGEIGEIMADPARATLGALRAFFRAGLREFHPEVSVTDAGNIIDDLGMQEASALIGRASVLGRPEAKGGKNPRKATTN